MMSRKPGFKVKESTKRKMSLIMSGRKRSKQYRIAISKAKIGNKNGMWKGEKAGYQSKHTWVRKHFGQPKRCENCGKDNLTSKKINWANISKKYIRKRWDWVRLCKSCHNKFDRYGMKIK